VNLAKDDPGESGLALKRRRYPVQPARSDLTAIRARRAAFERSRRRDRILVALETALRPLFTIPAASESTHDDGQAALRTFRRSPAQNLHD
jgi:hypothetical protein